MGITRKLLFSALLAPLLGGALLRAAEFEVLDRFSVDGYTVLRGSADITGGFTVGGATFTVKDGKVGIGTTGPAAQLHLANTIAAQGSGEAAGLGQLRLENGATGLSAAGGLEFKIAGDSNGYGSKIQALNSSGSQ